MQQNKTLHTIEVFIPKPFMLKYGEFLGFWDNRTPEQARDYYVVRKNPQTLYVVEGIDATG